MRQYNRTYNFTIFFPLIVSAHLFTVVMRGQDNSSFLRFSVSHQILKTLDSFLDLLFQCVFQYCISVSVTSGQITLFSFPSFLKYLRLTEWFQSVEVHILGVRSCFVCCLYPIGCCYVTDTAWSTADLIAWNNLCALSLCNMTLTSFKRQWFVTFLALNLVRDIFLASS